MALSVNGQWIVDDLDLGRGTLYHVAGVTGLDVGEVKFTDFDNGLDDGGFATEDRLGVREVIFSIGLEGDMDEEAYDTLKTALEAVWVPRTEDIVVSYRRFGRDRRFLARPRGLILPWDDDFFLGAANATGRLIAHDPVIYDDDETVVEDSGSFTVENLGNWSVWATLSIDNPGATVVVTNETDDEKSVVFSDLTGDAEVNMKRRIVTVAGLDVYGTVGPNPGWFRIRPGENTITMTGADALTVTFRSGWASG